MPVSAFNVFVTDLEHWFNSTVTGIIFVTVTAPSLPNILKMVVRLIREKF